MDTKAISNYSKQAYSSYMKEDIKNFSENMKNFYIEGIEKPSVAHIIIHDEFCKCGREDLAKEKSQKSIFNTKQLIENTFSSIKRLLTLSSCDLPQKGNCDESVLSYKKDFYNEYKNLYPKTYKLRQALIFSSRLPMDKVEPKANWRAKIGIRSLTKDFKEIYPKTFYMRYELYMQNKIKENEVTPKFNWFKKVLFARKLK